MSPLLAALYLKPSDDAMSRAGLAYVRYLDDWVVLAASRWRSRRAIRRVNAILNELKLVKHPHKTWIGPIDWALISWAITTPGRAVCPPRRYASGLLHD
ncbi:MAG: hypothetical protein WB783_06635 [Arenicellales bacterium]